MKRIFSLILVLSIAQISLGQFLDNFDTLSVGDKIGQSSPYWTTWSGTTGGNEDAAVVSNKSNSASNSLYFSSTSTTGGPQDVLLPFGGEYNYGTFNFEQAMFVESGKGAYFNLQAETTVGNIWAFNAHLVQDGKIYITNGSNITVIETTYPTNQWFDFELDINLNVNTWEVFINNVSLGSYQNEDNQVASLNLYPVNGVDYGGNNSSGFWIDDCGYSYAPYTLPNLNAGVSGIDMGNPVVVGVNKEPRIEVRNLGKTKITSFDISVNYNGNTETKSITGVNIDSLETYEFGLGKFFLVSGSATSISATVSNVNGLGADDDLNDDTKVVNFNTIIPAPGKLVVVEEGTGTWCGWCPRGTVAMEFLQRDYDGLAQGIAVHNGDPMVYEKYDDGIVKLISGFPSALVDRGTATDPSAIWDDVNERLQIAPNALLTPGANYNASTGELEVSITVDFVEDVAGDWRIACVLVEDSVSGTGSDFAQSNYYSGSQDLFNIYGQNWRNFANPVPASQMTYNHVARVITPAFDGAAGSLPASITKGDQHIFNFDYNVSSWDTDMMHIVGILIDNNKRIDNAGTATIDEAIANGYESGTTIVSNKELSAPDDFIKIYPNPTNQGFTNVVVGSSSGERLQFDILDQSGKLLNQIDYGVVSGPVMVQIPTTFLAEGFYFIRLTVGDRTEVRKLVVQ